MYLCSVSKTASFHAHSKAEKKTKQRLKYTRVSFPKGSRTLLFTLLFYSKLPTAHPNSAPCIGALSHAVAIPVPPSRHCPRPALTLQQLSCWGTMSARYHFVPFLHLFLFSFPSTLLLFLPLSFLFLSSDLFFLLSPPSLLRFLLPTEFLLQQVLVEPAGPAATPVLLQGDGSRLQPQQALLPEVRSVVLLDDNDTG